MIINRILILSVYIFIYALSGIIYAAQDNWEKFHENCLQNRMISIKNENIIITPFFPEDRDELKKIYSNKETNFIQEKSFNEEEKLKTISYTKLRNEIRENLKIIDYSIFVNKEENIFLAGTCSIENPGNDGWSEFKIIIRKELRGEKIGTNVTKEIYNNIKELIGKKVKTMFFYENLYTNGKDSYVESYDAETEDSEATFKGLQGWVHSENIASIRLMEKCGWEIYKTVGNIDNLGNVVKSNLYRSPPNGL